MKLVQVINGEIAQYSLPKTGTLKNGSTVSGYHLLDEEVLLVLEGSNYHSEVAEEPER